MREYFFMYVVEYNALTRTEYARIFYYCDFWRTLSFRPNTTTLYLMIFCKGELRNGTTYAKQAYLLLISRNSGVHKRMAFRGKKGWKSPIFFQLGSFFSAYLLIDLFERLLKKNTLTQSLNFDAI